ncbi:glycoside hydrolase family 3 protein [Candidatus Halobeggiatoa sp. HSG11]|nr:glycoside hydrolase family 3 protein [Candidatus Halobeggiatoa sp. HSG11]
MKHIKIVIIFLILSSVISSKGSFILKAEAQNIENKVYPVDSFVKDNSLKKQTIKPTLDEKVGQMLIVGFYGLTVNNESSIIKDIKEHHLGGVVLYDYDNTSGLYERNIKSPKQVKTLTSKLQAAAKIPLLVAVDQEGGMVQRLKKEYGFPNVFSAQFLGKKNDLNRTYKDAETIATTLKNVGINFNFAPVVDLNINPTSPAIGNLKRSFSADPVVVTNHAAKFIEAHRTHKVINALKHFPGHGSSTDDSHLAITDITDTWKNIELKPYIKLINDGMVDVIMTAHVFNRNLDPMFPATLSKITINGWLRGSLKYNGVIISDDMQMQSILSSYSLETAIKKSIEAGIDIILTCNNSQYDKGVVARMIDIIKTSVSEKKIDESYNRIMRLKKKWLY